MSSHPTPPLEFQHITQLRRIFRPAPDALVGIGDDAAVVEGPGAARVYTVDAAVEGVHFDCRWLSPREIGFRAFMAAASDVAAMGALASHALCAWTVPSDFEQADIWALATGIEQASRECAAPVLGGNLTRASLLTVTTTVVGTVQPPPVVRSGGQVGDVLYVTGPLGGPRVGLAQLQQDVTASDRFTRSFKSPRARLDVADKLREVAHCAIDLSDGLLPDLQHLCQQSGTGARVQLTALPRLSGHSEACRRLGLDDAEALLGGGEEYELLFAAAPTLSVPWATAIGSLEAAHFGIQVRTADGSNHPLPRGFEHFAQHPNRSPPSS